MDLCCLQSNELDE